MLKNVDPILNPETLMRLSAMGHGDEVVIADGNYPAMSKGIPVVDAAGTTVTDMVKGILKHFPLDARVEHAAFRMLVEAQPDEVPEVCQEVAQLIHESEPGFEVSALKREEFYARSARASFIIRTSDLRRFGNFILRKGVVTI